MFINHRSNVGPFLYDDVVNTLKELKSMNVITGVLTNGNADLNICKSLGPLIDFTIGAGDIGAMKPSILPFISAVQHCNIQNSKLLNDDKLRAIPPSRILFIGDSYEKDIIGALSVGMKAALITRNQLDCQHDTTSTEDNKEKFINQNNGKFIKINRLDIDHVMKSMSLL